MIAYLLCFVFVAAMGDDGLGNSNDFTLVDLKSHIDTIMNSAKYYLHEGAPSITELFFVENAVEIESLEKELRQKILDDLLHQLIEVWAQMNMRVLKGFRVLKSLRDKADLLVAELKEMGLVNIMGNKEVRRKLGERINELLQDAKQVFCVEDRNTTGLALQEADLLNLLSKLEHNAVKIHLLRMVYFFRIEHMLNETRTQKAETDEELDEIWRLVIAWGKWAVLDLMAFIKEPLNHIHTNVRQYVISHLETLQEETDKTLEAILETVIASGGDKHSVHVQELLTEVSEAEDPLHALCSH